MGTTEEKEMEDRAAMYTVAFELIDPQIDKQITNYSWKNTWLPINM